MHMEMHDPKKSLLDALVVIGFARNFRPRIQKTLTSKVLESCPSHSQKKLRI